MIEYTNGQFGAIAPAKDVLDMLARLPNLNEVKAVHIGSVSELQDIRQNKVNVDSIHERLNQLEAELATLKPKGPISIFLLEDIPK